MGKQYHQRPSSIIGLEPNGYEAFCFDEACSYILSELQKEDPKKPRFIDDVKQTNNNDVIEWLSENNKK